MEALQLVLSSAAEEIAKRMPEIIGALTLALVTWLHGQRAKRREIVKGAIAEVEASTKPQELLAPAEKLAAAVTIAAARMGASAPSDAKIEAMIEKNGPAVVADFGKRSSEPPTPNEAA